VLVGQLLLAVPQDGHRRGEDRGGNRQGGSGALQ
jgi:hypothetical protein